MSGIRTVLWKINELGLYINFKMMRLIYVMQQHICPTFKIYGKNLIPKLMEEQQY